MLARSLTLLLVLIASASAYGEVHPFEGTWEWVQTVEADGSIETPASTGHTEQCCFGPDQIFTYYVDEEISTQYAWAAGSMMIGDCCVEMVSVAGIDWAWTVVEGDTRTLTLQTGFECPTGGGTPIQEIATLIERGPVAVDARSWGGVKSLFQ